MLEKGVASGVDGSESELRMTAPLSDDEVSEVRARFELERRERGAIGEPWPTPSDGEISAVHDLFFQGCTLFDVVFELWLSPSMVSALWRSMGRPGRLYEDGEDELTDEMLVQLVRDLFVEIPRAEMERLRGREGFVDLGEVVVMRPGQGHGGRSGD
jgi:hypothetical protein